VTRSVRERKRRGTSADMLVGLVTGRLKRKLKSGPRLVAFFLKGGECPGRLSGKSTKLSSPPDWRGGEARKRKERKNGAPSGSPKLPGDFARCTSRQLFLSEGKKKSILSAAVLDVFRPTKGLWARLGHQAIRSRRVPSISGVEKPQRGHRHIHGEPRVNC